MVGAQGIGVGQPEAGASFRRSPELENGSAWN